MKKAVNLEKAISTSNSTELKRYLSTRSTELAKDEDPSRMPIHIPNVSTTRYYDQEDVAEILSTYYELSKDGYLSDREYLTKMSGRGGLYLDGDLRFKNSFCVANKPPIEDTVRIGKLYLESLLRELGKICMLEKPRNEYTAYLFVRSKMDRTVVDDVSCWKYGFHIYFNDISFSKEARRRSHEKVLQGLEGTQLGALIDDFMVGAPRDILDGKPLEGSCTFPLSQKPNGTRYVYNCNLDLRISPTNNGFNVIESKEIPLSFEQEDLIRAIPTVEHDRAKASSPYDDVPTKISPEMEDITSDSLSDQLLLDAKDQYLMDVARSIELLKMLPVNPYVTDHDYRLKIINILAHEDMDDEWRSKVLKWFLNQAPKADFNNPKHIDDRIAEAKRDGKQVSMGSLIHYARETDKKKANDILSTYKIETIDSILMSTYQYRASAYGRIPPATLAEALDKLCGQNYYVIQTKTNSSALGSYEFYHYNEKAEYGQQYKKYHYLSNPTIQMKDDLRKCVLPEIISLKSRLYTYQDSTDLDKKAQTIIKGKIKYLTDTVGALLDPKKISPIYTEFRDILSKRSEQIKFEDQLDADMLLTGTWNGVLKMNKETGEVELLDQDNREIFVSRSTGCKYNSNPDSKVLEILDKTIADIIPDADKRKYWYMLRAAVYLCGEGGELFEIQFGTGGDGKTTLANLESAMLGLVMANTNSRFIYAGKAPVTMFQYGKKDTNGHDGGIAHIVGFRRLGLSEPDESNPTLDGAAIKKYYSKEPVQLRDVGEKAKHTLIKNLPVLSTNVPLTFKNSNMGNLRRFVVMEMDQKFADKRNEHLYTNLSNVKYADSDVDTMIVSEEIREAFLYRLCQYAKIFCKEYDGKINNLVMPENMMQTTLNVTVATDIIGSYASRAMYWCPGNKAPMAEVYREFMRWQEGALSKKDYIDGTSGFLRILASSVLSQHVSDKDKAIGSMNMLARNINDLYLNNHQFISVREAKEKELEQTAD